MAAAAGARSGPPPVGGTLGEASVLAVIRAHSDGVSIQELSAAFPSQLEQLAGVLNSLGRRNALDIFNVSGPDGKQVTLYKAVESSLAEKLEGLSAEDKLVVQAIEKSGNTGIWVRNLKQVTKLQPATLTKILRTLLRLGIVKPVASIAHKNRKIYMMAHIEPSRDLTGGPWYTDNEMDYQFIADLRQFILADLARKPLTRTQLAKRIALSGLSAVPLTVTDVQSLLDSLMFDNKIIKSEEDVADGVRLLFTADAKSTEDAVRWRLARTFDDHDHLSQIPCGLCPVAERCEPGGVVAPETCAYYNAWLAQAMDECDGAHALG